MADAHGFEAHGSEAHGFEAHGFEAHGFEAYRDRGADDVGLALFDGSPFDDGQDQRAAPRFLQPTWMRRGESSSERGWLPLVAVVVLAVVGLTGAVLINVGGRTVKPPPAPLPAHPFSATTLPALPASEQVPVAGSTAAAGGGAGSSSPTGPGRGSGSPWTFSEASRLYIQSLNIDAPIVEDPTQQNELVGPGNVKQVGRWTGGAALDATDGTVDLAGHVNYVGQGNGALYDLYRISPGAVVVTTDGAGRRTPWRVTSLQVVAKNALPASLFTRTGPRTLKIITCGGSLVHVSGPGGGYYTYTDNVIATATPLATT